MGKKTKKKNSLLPTSKNGFISKRLYAARLMQAVLDVTAEAGMDIATAKKVLKQMPDVLDSYACPKSGNFSIKCNGNVKPLKEVWGK